MNHKTLINQNLTFCSLKDIIKKAKESHYRLEEVFDEHIHLIKDLLSRI